MDPSSGSSTSSSSQSVDTILHSLKAAIWARRPILGEIMTKHGEQNLFEYSLDFMDVNAAPLLDARKEELIGIFEELLGDRLGKTVATAVAAQLRRLALVSTTDHHGPIQHPFFLNANIVSALPVLDRSADWDYYKYLVVLSFASISVNNASTYTRGVMFHGGMNGSGNLIRLPILPDKLKMGVVYATRGFSREDLSKAEDELMKKEQKGEIAKGRGEKLRAFMEKYFGTTDVLEAPDLNAQITKINYHMWPQFFHKPGGEASGHMPDLIYYEIETLVAEMLQRVHLKQPESLLYKVLFDPSYRDLLLKYFNNLPGAFSLEKEWGTYLFWGLDDKQHRVRLKLEGDKITSFGGTISSELTPDAIGQALKNKTIYPSMMLCYMMVSLYYGMKCLGGFCQVHDLTVMKEAWEKLLRDAGKMEEAEAAAPIQTKELGGDGMVLSYMHTPNSEVVPATGFDMLLDSGDTTADHYLALSKKVTLGEIMNPMLPEIYTVLYPIDERDPALTTLLPEKIFRDTGLENKLIEHTSLTTSANG
jgi:hypothetical protein